MKTREWVIRVADSMFGWFVVFVINVGAIAFMGILFAYAFWNDLSLFVTGRHYCSGQVQKWPKRLCKLCHYPENPNGIYPKEDIHRPPS